MTHKMIDVSSNNHEGGEGFNWTMIRQAGVTAVMIKATEGSEYVNPYLEQDSQGAAAAGLLVGYYHFGQVSVTDAAQQAEHLVSTTDNLPRSIGLSLDLEVASGESWAWLGQWANAFLSAVPESVKYRTLYTSESWGTSMAHLVSEWPWWCASWGKRPRQNVWAWQSGQQQVPGMPDLVDVSTLYV